MDGGFGETADEKIAAKQGNDRSQPGRQIQEHAARLVDEHRGTKILREIGGRVAARGYLSADLSGVAELRTDSWLFGTLFRWDFVSDKSAPLVAVFEMETVTAGLLVGRRIPFGFGSFDTGLSPRLVVETQTYEAKAGEQSKSATDVRLGAFARLAFGKSSLRALVELDGELSPSRLRRIVQLDPLLPALPAWSAGLTAGVMWAAVP